RDVRHGVPRDDHEHLLQSDRDQRAVLALRRHRLDLPVPAPLSDRPARVTTHILPTRIYYAIFAILILCTGITVAVAFIDLGPLNVVAALTIAVFKAVLVVLFFMHVRYSPRLTWVVIIGAVFWLIILLTMTMSDYLTRPWRTYG